jgi:histone H3/H4
MPQEKTKLPLAPLERILRKAGARRVSKKAVREFAMVLADYAHDVSAEASKLAVHAGRKTIVESDVRMARKRLA